MSLHVCLGEMFISDSRLAIFGGRNCPFGFLLVVFCPGVSVTLCCFVVYSTRRFVLCLSLCYFVLVFFSPFSIAITSLGKKRANLSAFRTFVRFMLVWFCRFPLPLGVWEGLRFVIVALPGLFSYLLFCDCGTPWTFLLPYFDCGAVTLSASFFPFGVLERNMLGNCIDS